MAKRALPILLLIVLPLSACKQEQPAPATEAAQSPAMQLAQAEPHLADQWLGQWTGPEGTRLEIAKAGENEYSLSIRSLDGIAVYMGKATAEGIAFMRAEQQETITAGDGPKTGMKWLQEKKNCLVIKTGEGFCRD